MRTFALITCFILSFSCQSLSITWVKTNAPPFNMPADSEPLGVCDLFVDEIIKRTPNIKHEVIALPQARINRYFEQGKNLCYPCMIKKPDNSLFKYSVATSIYPPYRVISKVEKQSELIRKHGNPISLPSLFADPTLRYGQSVARRYSETIQSLKRNIRSEQEVALNYRADDQAAALGDMLVSDRIDYGIDYPFIADYYNQINGRQLLASTLVNERHSGIILGAVGCATKAPNDFAESVLATINPIIINEILPSQGYRAHQQHWLKKYFKDFDGVYQEKLLPRTEHE